MNQIEGTALAKNRLNKTLKVLCTKSMEYSTNSDKLHNFKKAAALRDKTPEEALMGMVTKHWVAIDDFVQQIEKHPRDYSQWDEKIGDIIVYMILLEWLVVERYGLEK